MEIMKQLEKEIIKLWEEVMKYEVIRLENLIKALEFYCDKYSTIYSEILINPEYFKNLTPVQDIQNFYRINKILKSEEQELINSEIQSENNNNLGLKDLENFFINFEVYKTILMLLY